MLLVTYGKLGSVLIYLFKGGVYYFYSHKCKYFIHYKRRVTYRFCPRETSYGRFSGDPPPRP